MGGTGSQVSLLHGVLIWSFQPTWHNLEPNGILIPTNKQYISKMWWSCNVRSQFVVSSPLLLIYSNRGFEQISHHSTVLGPPVLQLQGLKASHRRSWHLNLGSPAVWHIKLREWGTVPVWATLKYGQPLVHFLPWNPSSRSYHTYIHMIHMIYMKYNTISNSIIYNQKI